jgi:hypothetical protein
MRNLLIALFAACALAVFMAAPQTASAEDPLPCAATDGDMDGDGVLDEDDSDELDACHLSSSGLEDCSTGAGDGLPDFRVCS